MVILGLYGVYDTTVPSPMQNDGKDWSHDGGASLFIDGKFISYITEERLSRKKYDCRFPKKSINYCLKEANLTRDDVDVVCITGNSTNLFVKNHHESNIYYNFLRSAFPNAQIKVYNHHYSHALSSIYTSNQDEGCFFVIDGQGSSFVSDFRNLDLRSDVNLVNRNEGEQCSFGYFNKKKKAILPFNVSSPGANIFGDFYSLIAQCVYSEIYESNLPKLKKFKKNTKVTELLREFASGKIMGLSAYGKTELTSKDIFWNVISPKEYGTIPEISFMYINEWFQLESNKAKFKNDPIKYSYIVQKNFEDALLKYITELNKRQYLEKNVCFSGGCFLNVLTNSLIKKTNIFENIHIPTFTNDSGLCFGAGIAGCLEYEEEIQVPDNIAFLGREYDSSDIEQALKKYNVEYDELSFDNMIKNVSKDLNENKIVAWFQDRSEAGPRALGSRSLLMNPTPAENKDIMNERVKHREIWRPFAGIILEEHTSEYFEEDWTSPHMLYSFVVKEEMVDKIAAITHIDNTCRIQTASEKDNPKITKLLKEYRNLSGIPVILNTSFNDNGEPIVESPEDAVKAFLNMNVDTLAIGNFIVRKNEQTRINNFKESNL